MIRGVVFDLDDTLYLERDYVRSGFSFIAELLTKDASISKEEVFGCLWGFFLQGEKGNIFDQCLERYPILREQFTIDELVTSYRGHRPLINLFPEIKDWLGQNQGRFYLGIISDGPLESQQAKVDSLGVKEIIPRIILTDTWGKEFWKPNPRSFQLLSDQWGLKGDELLYIGDNPAKDFIAPKKMGWKTIRLSMAGQLHYGRKPLTAAAAPEQEINSLEALIENLNGI